METNLFLEIIPPESKPYLVLIRIPVSSTGEAKVYIEKIVRDEYYDAAVKLHTCHHSLEDSEPCTSLTWVDGEFV